MSRKKKILIITISMSFLILLLIATILFVNFIKESITLKENLTFEINSQNNILSLIENIGDVKIINGNEIIDTSKLGEKELTIKYLNSSNQEKNISVKINIIDTTKPVIESEEIINCTVGTKPDLLKNVTVSDNSNENITPNIEGEYDYNKIGEYQLKYIATDISGNKSEKDFILKINPATIKTTGYYVHKNKSEWYAMTFDKNGKATYLLNPCPGLACGAYSAYGTYKVENDLVVVKITHQVPDVGDVEKLSKPITWNFKIENENLITKDNEEYDYKKSFN